MRNIYYYMQLHEYDTKKRNEIIEEFILFDDTAQELYGSMVDNVSGVAFSNTEFNITRFIEDLQQLTQRIYNCLMFQSEAIVTVEKYTGDTGAYLQEGHYVDLPNFVDSKLVQKYLVRDQEYRYEVPPDQFVMERVIGQVGRLIQGYADAR